MKTKSILISSLAALSLLHSCLPLRAAEFFIAPTGLPTGDGSVGRPWDIQTAFYHPAALKPGDTLWLRGGVYRANWTPTMGRTYFANLMGTPAQPILIKQYPGEAAVVDGGISCKAGSGWYQFWGFRVTNTDTNRVITASANARATGLLLEGRGLKIINMVVDNASTPILWTDSGLPDGDEAEIYGCIVYGGGVYDAATPGYTPESPWIRGNGIYSQNKNGHRYMRDNICFRNFTGGLMIYAEGGYANGMVMEGNIAFDPAGGAAFEATSKDHPITSITMLNNFGFSEKPGNLFWIGYRARHNQNAYIVGNYGASLGAGTTGLFAVKNWDTAVIRSNTFYCFGAKRTLASIDMTDGITGYPFDWDYNAYYSSNNTAFITNNAIPNKSFAEWKAMSGYDAHSTFANASPSTLTHFTRRNKYDPARSHLVVFNWIGATALSYNLSAAGISVGDRYEIRDAQNYHGTPALSGVYGGGSVSIPLTLTNVARIYGNLIHFENKHTPSSFNAFVVIRSPVTNGVPPVNVAPTMRTVTVASASPNSGVTIAMSPSSSNGLAGGTTPFTRAYTNNTIVAVAAPASAGGNTFVKWQRNGVDYGNNLKAIVTLGGDQTLTAVYQPPAPLTRTLTVLSANAVSDVAVAVSPADQNGAGAGTTTFTRVYLRNVVVGLTAPASAGGNPFVKWQCDGVDLTASRTAMVRMDANHLLVALYDGGDLTGWWTFNGSRSNRVYDASEFANHGVLTSGPVITNAACGGGLFFDGVNDFVRVADADALDFNGRAFTVALKMKTTRTSPQALIEKQHQSFAGFFLFALNRDSTVPGGFSVWTGDDWIDSDWRGATDGAFHDLAVTYDGASFRLYRDGVLDKTQAAAASYVNTALPMNFGRFATTGVGWPFGGVMDEVRLYDRALGDAEVAALVNCPTVASEPSWLTAQFSAPGDTVPRILSMTRSQPGEGRLQISGRIGQSYGIEASSNLTDWVQIGAATVSVNGQCEFIDTHAAEHPNRFYRVVGP